MIAALGLALVRPFHKLSRLAFSVGDSRTLPSDPALLLLPNETPLDLARGRLPEVGVVGPWSMLEVQPDTEWVCNLAGRGRGMCRSRYSDKVGWCNSPRVRQPANECTPLGGDVGMVTAKVLVVGWWREGKVSSRNYNAAGRRRELDGSAKWPRQPNECGLALPRAIRGVVVASAAESRRSVGGERAWGAGVDKDV